MKPSDIQDEIINVLKFAHDLYSTFGLQYRLELSTRPEKNTIGSDEEWEIATQGLKGRWILLAGNTRSMKGMGLFMVQKSTFISKMPSTALGNVGQFS